MNVVSLIEEIERQNIGKLCRVDLKDGTYYVKFIDEYEESKIIIESWRNPIEISTYPLKNGRIFRSNIRVLDNSVSVDSVISLIYLKLNGNDDHNLIDLYFKFRDSSRKDLKYYYVHDKIISEQVNMSYTKTYFERLIRPEYYIESFTEKIKLYLVYKYVEGNSFKVGLRISTSQVVEDKHNLLESIPDSVQDSRKVLESVIWNWEIPDTESKTLSDLQQKLDVFIKKEVLPSYILYK